MGYIDEALELINESKKTLKTIREIYDKSLQEKEVKTSLLIKIKNYLENLRSSLDFTAYHLFDKYGSSTRSNPKIYFPYAWSGLNQTDFTIRNVIDNKIPGLSVNRPDIATKIESFQWFSATENNWLPKFMDLNNENKHKRLSSQERKEIKELRVKSRNVGISMSGGASIKMTGNASMRFGDALITGNQHFSADKPPIIHGKATKEIITWVSFRFSEIDEPVLPFLEKCLAGTEKIFNELKDI